MSWMSIQFKLYDFNPKDLKPGHLIYDSSDGKIRTVIKIYQKGVMTISKNDIEDFFYFEDDENYYGRWVLTNERYKTVGKIKGEE